MEEKESKWSHFNMALECLLKDSRFKVNNYTYAPREQFDKATYFHGGTGKGISKLVMSSSSPPIRDWQVKEPHTKSQ